MVVEAVHGFYVPFAEEPFVHHERQILHVEGIALLQYVLQCGDIGYRPVVYLVVERKPVAGIGHHSQIDLRKVLLVSVVSVFDNVALERV